MANLVLDFRDPTKKTVADQSFKQVLGRILHEKGKEPNFVEGEEGQVEVLVPDEWSDKEVSDFAETILKELIDAGVY